MRWLAVVCLVGGAGCLEGGSEPTGQVVVPLVASGADGATYRLPQGTQLIISQSGYVRQMAIDGDQPSLTVEVPPGDYVAFMFDGAGHTTTWPLDRIAADGTVTQVEATFEQPPPFTVAVGETTTLTLQFRAALADVITFAVGAVHVDVAIDEGAASSYRLDLAGVGLDLSVNQAVTVLPDLAQFQSFALTAHTTSAWRLAGPSTACAEAMIAWQTTLDQIRLIEEAFDEAVPHTVCVSQLGPQFARLALVITRIGAPRTDLFSQFSTLRVTSAFTLDVPIEVLDGATLHLAALARLLPASVGLGINFESQLEDGSFQQLANVFEVGGGHAQLTAL